MNELHTALLLGLYALLSGFYGLAYALARLRASAPLRLAASIFVFAHLAVLGVILALMPLALIWKVLLGASSAALIAIPPVTSRMVETTHAHPE